MQYSIITIIILIMIVILLKSIYIKLESKDLPYILNNALMSNAEILLYKELKKITEKYNWELFSKVRLLDIVRTKPKSNIKNFNKIKSKHIDFIICNTTLNFLLAIELNDKSHLKENRIKRDEFISNIFKKVNLPFIAIKASNYYNNAEIETIILKSINQEKISEEKQLT